MNTNSLSVRLRSLSTVKFLFTIAVGASSLLGNLSIPSAIAQSTINQGTTIAQAGKFNAPKPPTGPVPGGRVRGGATRGNNIVVCPKPKPDFTALVYNTEADNNVTNVWGYTTQARPSLLFYVPFSQESKYQTKFTIKEEDINSPPDRGKSFYTGTIPLPEKPGIVSWKLPAQAGELKVGKRYRWYFTINCDQEKKSLPTYVEGVIYRVKLNSVDEQNLRKSSLYDKLVIYLRNGIWYDAIATLAELRRQNPQYQVLKDNWQSLLQDVSLEDVADQPILAGK